MARRTDGSRLGKLQPDGKMVNKWLSLHCVDIGSGESVNDSNWDSRVIWLAQGAGVLEVLSSASQAMVSFGGLMA